MFNSPSIGLRKSHAPSGDAGGGNLHDGEELTHAEVLALRQEYLPTAVFNYYREPVNLVRGVMQYLYDETGRISTPSAAS